MINSILNHHTDCVYFHNIKTPTDLITNPTHIKNHIRSHFENWTAYRPFNTSIFNQYWLQEYQPLPHINSHWYNSVLNEITYEEILQTIQQLPNNKACGPSGISYEMLKHIGQNAINSITSLLNRCLSSNTISKQ
jgi:hypothetical protein